MIMTVGPEHARGSLWWESQIFQHRVCFWLQLCRLWQLTRQPGNSVVVWGLAIHWWLINVQKAQLSSEVLKLCSLDMLHMKLPKYGYLISFCRLFKNSQPYFYHEKKKIQPCVFHVFTVKLNFLWMRFQQCRWACFFEMTWSNCVYVCMCMFKMLSIHLVFIITVDIL